MNRKMRHRAIRSIAKHIGSLWILLGAFIIIPSLVSLNYSEWYHVLGFLISGLFVSGLGFLLYRRFRNESDSFFYEAILVSSVGWFSIAVMGAIPFFIISLVIPEQAMHSLIPANTEYAASSLNYFRNPLHCLFESMSAYTTTGLTMAVHEPSIGKGLLFYRSLAQWFGGLGFIVTVLAIFRPVTGREAFLLFHSDTSSEKFKPKVIHTVRAIWGTYLLITAFMVLYLFTGTLFILPDYPVSDALFDSVNHAMCGLSTGGFSTLDDSIAGYQSSTMEALHILPMVMGSFSILFYYKMIKSRHLAEFWKDLQTRNLLFAFTLGGIILSFLLSSRDQVSEPFRIGLFQFISAMSTTGWQTSDVSSWNQGTIIYIIFAAMVIGGAAGATVGGIKIIRLLMIILGLRWQINSIFLSEHTIKIAHFNGKTLLPDDINREFSRSAGMAIFFLLLLFTCTIFTGLVTGQDVPFIHLLFESASAQATVGLSCGITDPSMSPVIESVYIFQMWAGRLEILPVLALFRLMMLGSKPRNI